MLPDFLSPLLPQQEIDVVFSSASRELCDALAYLHQKHSTEIEFIREKLISYSVHVANLAITHPVFQAITATGRLGTDQYASQRSISKVPMDAVGGFLGQNGAGSFPYEILYSGAQASQQLSVVPDAYLSGPQLEMACATDFAGPIVPAACATDLTSGQETGTFLYHDRIMGHESDTWLTDGAQHPTERERPIMPRDVMQRAACADFSDPIPQACGRKKDHRARAQKHKEKQKRNCMTLLTVIGDTECIARAKALFRSKTDVDWPLFSLSRLALDDVFRVLHDIENMHHALVVRRRLGLIRLLEHYILLKQAIEAEMDYGRRDGGQPVPDKLESAVIDRLVQIANPKIGPPDGAKSKKQWRAKNAPERKRVSNQLHAAKHWKKAVDEFGLGIVLLFPLDRIEVTNTAFETFSDDITEQLLTGLRGKGEGRIAKVAESWTPFIEALYAGRSNPNALLPNHDDEAQLP